jgi:hypothetical protein
MTYDTELTRFQNFVRNIGVNVPDHVNPDNEGAYVNAAVARIASNWIKGNHARWFAAHSDAKTLRDWLLGYDDTLPRRPSGAGFGELLDKLARDLDQCGNLSDKQTSIVRNALARQIEFAANRKAEYAAKDASSQHIGTVGKRDTFGLTVQWSKSFEGQYGLSYIFGLRDAANNIVIYKGTKYLGDKGQSINVKATVAEHGERDGVRQTIISRPAAV